MITKQAMILGAIGLTVAVGLLGCGRSESTTSTSANSGNGMSGIGSGREVTGPAAEGEPRVYGVEVAGAPTFGTPSGMGFATGDSAHTGQGSGQMGFHQTGAAGTSGTITDHRIAAEQPDATPHEQR
jgi:hypothetical protein